MNINLDRLFEMADNDNLCNVKVLYDNGCKEYKVCDGNGLVVLRGDKEEDIFLLFKYPEVYVDEISKYLDSDKALLSKYFENPNSVRHMLRMKFRDLLMDKAKEMCSEMKDSSDHKVIVKESVSSKPIYKSKTIAFNTTVLVTSLALILKGLSDKNYHEIAEGLVPLVISIVNFILRLVTNKPIKL